MFEEEVDKAITSMEGGGEKEIALGVAEVRIDKAAVMALESSGESCDCRNAAAVVGSLKPALKSLSCGW
jgi:hypothetical protein